jgi:trehalose-6-phosphate synthase
LDFFINVRRARVGKLANGWAGVRPYDERVKHEPRLIIVSNRPPISVAEGPQGLWVKRAPGGLASALAQVWERPGCIWVGWSGASRSLSHEEFEQLSLGEKLALVNLESHLYKRYYDAFANATLWPVFHGFEPRNRYTAEDLEAVETAMDRFARCIQWLAGPHDVIWVHDFHLAFLPAKLRELGMKQRVGFFLHIPFPSPHQFRQIRDHERLARSLMQADLVGVQAQRDERQLRHYLASAGIEASADIGVFPIGIDYQEYHDRVFRPESAVHVAELALRYEGKVVLLAASRLDYTKGIPQQLQAFERLLERTRRRDLVFKLVVVPSRESLEEYQEVREAAEALVAQINQRYEWQPVEYTYESYGLDELCAWYARADVMIVAPVIDGMNLVAKEYVATHDDTGVLVLGRKAGAAGQLKRAVLTDPEDVAGLTEDLERALNMPLSERRRRMHALRRVVQEQSVQWWAQTYLERLGA